MNFKPGDRVSQHTLTEILGRGGNADVWCADGPLGLIALKILRKIDPRSEPYQRFKREVEQHSRLDHPGVLPLLGAHLPSRPSRRDRAWLAMPVAMPMTTALGKHSAGVRGAFCLMAWRDDRAESGLR